jgi:hypothetical protein
VYLSILVVRVELGGKWGAIIKCPYSYTTAIKDLQRINCLMRAVKGFLVIGLRIVEDGIPV